MKVHVQAFTGIMLVYLAESGNGAWMMQIEWQRRRKPSWSKRWSLIALPTSTCSCTVPWQPPSHAYINAMIIIKDITKSPTIYRPFFRALAVSWVLSTTMSESSSSGLLCTVPCWVLLSEYSIKLVNFSQTHKGCVWLKLTNFIEFSKHLGMVNTKKKNSSVYSAASDLKSSWI